MNIVSYSDWAFDLANSYWDPQHYAQPEQLPDLEALRGFLASMPRWQRDATEDDLVRLREVRTRFRTLLEHGLHEETRCQAVDELNALMAEFQVRPQLSTHGDVGLHLHLADCDLPVWQELTAAAALGLALRLSDLGFERLGMCGERRCHDIFLDTSTNAARRYCSDGCANRANVAAYRARRKAEATS